MRRKEKLLSRDQTYYTERYHKNIDSNINDLQGEDYARALERVLSNILMKGLENFTFDKTSLNCLKIKKCNSSISLNSKKSKFLKIDNDEKISSKQNQEELNSIKKALSSNKNSDTRVVSLYKIKHPNNSNNRLKSMADLSLNNNYIIESTRNNKQNTDFDAFVFNNSIKNSEHLSTNNHTGKYIKFLKIIKHLY